MKALRSPGRLDFLVLAFIVLMGASFRLQWIGAPLLDAHRWRQVDTASIARTFYEERFNLFYPEVNWGGREGYVESEFPLLQGMVASLYEVFGPEDYLGRVVVVAFSIATIVAMFYLAAELLGAAGGLAAAFLMAASPAAAYFGRTFMPDSVMLFFWVLGVLAFVRYFRTGSRGDLSLGGVATMLACLVKIPAVMMLAPIAAAAWQAKGRKALSDRAFLVALAVPLLVTTAWYLHAFLLYRKTGLTFGILIHPARTYPLSVSPGPWKSAFSKWSSLALLQSSDFYLTLLARLYELLLLPWGFAGAMIGAAVWKYRDRRLIADAWLLAFVAFIFAAGEAHIGHEYYQLPIVPLGALYFGAFAGPILESSWKPVQGTGVRSAALLVSMLAIIGVTGIYYSGIINSHFRPNGLDVRVVQAGQAVQQAVPRESLLIVADDYGVTSPLLLYFAHRKGWSFDVEDLNPHVIDGLRRKGATFFVSTVWPRVESERPEVTAYLGLYRRVPLHDEPKDTVVFDLSSRLDE